MSFDVAASAYDQFMGCWSGPLAEQFVELTGVHGGQRVLDVGCGPGALTGRLVERLGPTGVVAVDPSNSFVDAIRSRFPEVDVRVASAEALPFPDNHFDAALAQLVVHFMSDPVTGLSEMARVVRPGGVIAACVWDQAGDSGPLSPFYRALRELDPAASDEAQLPGVREGHLAVLCEAAALRKIASGSLTVHLQFATFEEWWGPFTLGVGPAGASVTRLDDAGRARLRYRCEQLLPAAPFEVSGTAWSVLAVV